MKLVTWVTCSHCGHQMQKYQVKEGDETNCYRCKEKFIIKGENEWQSVKGCENGGWEWENVARLNGEP